jgi:putative FmdB family regulatory protein
VDGSQHAAHDLDRMAGRCEVLAFGLLRQEPPSDSHEAQAQLRQHRHGRKRSRDCNIECLSEARIVTRVLCPTGHDVHTLETERRARVNQEGGLGLVRLDQGELQLRSNDLERKAGQTRPRADVDHRPSFAEMIGQDEAVLYQRRIGPCHKAGPLHNQLCELKQLRIVHDLPIYEYRCESCSKTFDLLTRFAERDVAQVCPACESTRTRVLVSSFAFAGAGDSSSALDLGSGESAGGCCGGSCGSCGSSPN